MSDVKPNPVAEKRPAGPPPAPRLAGDKIIFYCPNGDRIVVPASLGGKKGQCTKCQVQVSIPLLEPTPAPPAAPTVEMPPVAPASGAGDGHPGPVGPPLTVEEMHAGMPSVPEPPPEPPPPAEQVDWDLVAGQSVAEVIPDVGEFDAAGQHAGAMPGSDHHPAARLVARLWQERAHGGIIELHLAGGSVILPEWYEVNWSRGTHGLFASQAADGSVTMTAIAWDTLEKIVVRQVRDLPQGFE